MWLFRNTKTEKYFEFLIGGLLCAHAQMGLYRICMNLGETCLRVLYSWKIIIWNNASLSPIKSMLWQNYNIQFFSVLTIYFVKYSIIEKDSSSVYRVQSLCLYVTVLNPLKMKGFVKDMCMWHGILHNPCRSNEVFIYCIFSS